LKITYKNTGSSAGKEAGAGNNDNNAPEPWKQVNSKVKFQQAAEPKEQQPQPRPRLGLFDL